MADHFKTSFFLENKVYPLTLEGEAGPIEAILNVPAEAHQEKIALIGHPHSLHGGTMENKVVTTLSKGLNECGIATLRLNFRGVGKSGGQFDKGVGESKDVLKIIEQLKHETDIRTCLLLGFSFGAYVMYRVACQCPHDLLISIAPAVNHGDFKAFDVVPTPWYVLVAGADEIVPEKDILSWYESVEPKPIIKTFEGTSHFFHGKLIELKKAVKDILSNG